MDIEKLAQLLVNVSYQIDAYEAWDNDYSVDQAMKDLTETPLLVIEGLLKYLEEDK